MRKAIWNNFEWFFWCNRIISTFARTMATETLLFTRHHSVYWWLCLYCSIFTILLSIYCYIRPTTSLVSYRNCHTVTLIPNSNAMQCLCMCAQLNSNLLFQFLCHSSWNSISYHAIEKQIGEILKCFRLCSFSFFLSLAYPRCPIISSPHLNRVYSRSIFAYHSNSKMIIPYDYYYYWNYLR